MSFSVKSSNLFAKKINRQAMFSNEEEQKRIDEDLNSGVEETKTETRQRPVVLPPVTNGMAIRINDYSMEDGY